MMISFKQHFNESLNRPYPLKWLVRSKMFWIAEVKLSGKSSHGMKISIGQEEGLGVWNILFTVDGTTEKTEMGDQFRIFATVKSAIEEWWEWASKNRDRVKSITFSADKSRDESRTKLYKRFANQLAKETGFNLSIKSTNTSDVFELKKEK